MVIGDFVGLECEESFDAGSPMHMLMIYEGIKNDREADPDWIMRSPSPVSLYYAPSILFLPQRIFTIQIL